MSRVRLPSPAPSPLSLNSPAPESVSGSVSHDEASTVVHSPGPVLAARHCGPRAVPDRVAAPAAVPNRRIRCQRRAAVHLGVVHASGARNPQDRLKRPRLATLPVWPVSPLYTPSTSTPNSLNRNSRPATPPALSTTTRHLSS